MSRPRVYVCVERGCGKRREQRELAAGVARVAEIVPVSCQSVCKGPVAGAVLDGRLQWFQQVRTDKARRALARAVRRGRPELPRPLAKRRVDKRAGRLQGRVRP